MRALGAAVVCGTLWVGPLHADAQADTRWWNGLPPEPTPASLQPGHEPLHGGTMSATDGDTDTDTETDTDVTATATDTDTDTATATDTDASATDASATDATATDATTSDDTTGDDTTGDGTTTDTFGTSGASTTDGMDSIGDDDFLSGPGCDGDLDDSDPGCCDHEENNSDNFLCAVGARRDRVILAIVLLLLGRPRKPKRRRS